MGNFITYLRWRGDLSWEQHPFNDVDNLLLAQLNYLDLHGIVPTQFDRKHAITVQQAASLWESAARQQISICQTEPPLLLEMAKTARFAEARPMGYADEVDADQSKQFAALTICLPDGTMYVAYRGTDVTLVGWREDFCASYEVTQAQKRAVAYLSKLGRKFPSQLLRIGGHSKGGNLAVFAAACASPQLQARIQTVYSNDGPGLCAELTDEAGYARIADKIKRICPGYSIVGMLFDRGEPISVVRSVGNGLMQHDPYTWQVVGDCFEALPDLLPEAKLIHGIFDEWLTQTDLPHRRAFVDDFFKALGEGGATTLPELTEGKGGFLHVLYAMIGKSSGKARQTFGQLVGAVVKQVCTLDLLALIKTRTVKQAGLMLVIGIFFVCSPAWALKMLGRLLFLWLLGYSAWQLQAVLQSSKKKKAVDYGKLLFFGVVCVVEVFCMLKGSVAIFSANIALAALFGWRCVSAVRNAAKRQRQSVQHGLLSLADAILAGMLCIVALSAGNSALIEFIMPAGTYLILYAAAVFTRDLFEQQRKLRREQRIQGQSAVENE